LEEIRIRLALFNELTNDEQNQLLLRVSYFSNSDRESQIVKFYKVQDSLFMTCKFEGDNVVDLADFNIENLKKGELRTLKNELKRNREGIFDPHIQKLVSKAIIPDSLAFHYSQITSPVTEYLIDRLFNGLSKLEIEDDGPLNQSDLNPTSNYHSRALLVLEWSDNGTQKAYIRNFPDKEVENFMHMVLSKCDQRHLIRSK
jgi:hypothetical protein